ncbi:tripartite tricarboxylate transporter TctB family protein [Aurantimonas sp. A3-2-R12]|uniref:tripartite tricarboxylate transporter TctB family protein n=1 Tax=Aurantimonas sp. A3-2-R12 TaxID=3114362 RepID=UPI002E1739D9|nr:tripartite tricarboxylate transporter TctB family protein [Aurantimonas sp. A3-2-R12]
MAWADRIIGSLIILACIPFWFLADRFPELAGNFPKTVVVTIAGLSALMVGRSFVGPEIDVGTGRLEARAFALPLLVAIASVLAVLAMAFVGYFPAMIALCIGLFFPLAGNRRLLYAVAVISSLAFIYVVFVLLLGVPLERSPFFGR